MRIFLIGASGYIGGAAATALIAAWGHATAVYSLGSNSRVRGKTAGALGWAPTQRSITQWIAEELT